MPQSLLQLVRQGSFTDNEKMRSRDENYSAASRDSTSMALEREREKLDQRIDPKPEEQGVEQYMKEKKMDEMG